MNTDDLRVAWHPGKQRTLMSQAADEIDRLTERVNSLEEQLSAAEADRDYWERRRCFHDD